MHLTLRVILKALYVKREKLKGFNKLRKMYPAPSNESSVWYVGNSNERQLIETVRASGVVDVEAALKPEKFKKESVEEVKSWRRE